MPASSANESFVSTSSAWASCAIWMAMRSFCHHRSHRGGALASISGADVDASAPPTRGSGGGGEDDGGESPAEQIQVDRPVLDQRLTERGLVRAHQDHRGVACRDRQLQAQRIEDRQHERFEIDLDLLPCGDELTPDDIVADAAELELCVH